MKGVSPLIGQTPEPLSNPPTNPTKILVVEDEALIRETIVFALQEEGYEVEVIADGRAALDLFYRGFEQDGSALLPDLVVLDLMLPQINGLDLCRFIRRQGSSMPILILSAKGTETDRVVGLEVGADDYLSKPFGMRELIARCRALLRRTQQHREEQEGEAIAFKEILLYPQQCRILLRGEEVNLSPKEFRMMELFIQHPKRVWSREQLLERIWGPDFMGDSKTVDVHIRWLREKLEVEPSSPQYLKTVRGFGYRFG
ncbi:MAG: response regulator transcription factor [Synechococcales cyanobacterium RU_4_20]|nr:response regulator transcription factor [Synechococcales cyanobacterium RU_4_20]NJR69232.1 response regulator transcription factor [Synechococcales cyanobacterium CRU_2_2]